MIDVGARASRSFHPPVAANLPGEDDAAELKAALKSSAVA